MSYDDRFVTAIDVPVKQNILYDYDDMYGVVEDKFDPPENEHLTPTVSMIEILGGKCTICPEKNEKLLSIQYVRDSKENSPEYVKELAEKAMMNGENLNKDFRVLCHNCNIRMKEMRRFLKHTGLNELSQEKLEHGLRMMNT